MIDKFRGRILRAPPARNEMNVGRILPRVCRDFTELNPGILLCGDGRTEVEGTTEVGFETMETSHFFVKVNDVHCDSTVVNRSSKFVWSNNAPRWPYPRPDG